MIFFRGKNLYSVTEEVKIVKRKSNAVASYDHRFNLFKFYLILINRRTFINIVLFNKRTISTRTDTFLFIWKKEYVLLH